VALPGGSVTGIVDVVVVGAGPGGASAAFHLARGGVSVALVDAQPNTVDGSGCCAISALARDCLTGMGLAQWVDNHPPTSEVSLWGPRGSRARLRLPAGRRTAVFIPRGELNAKLVATAAEAGVSLQADTLVQGVTSEVDGVRLRAALELPKARLAILAEGAAAPLAASLGMVRRGPDFLSLHAEYAYDAAGATEFHYLPKALACVAWAFSCGSGIANVGVSTSARDVREGKTDPEALLDEFAATRAFGGALSGKRRLSAPVLSSIRCWLESVIPYGERVLLAGAAAGVTHPLTFESLGTALESGRIVAQHALYGLEKRRLSATDLSAYLPALQRRFAMEHRPARVLRAMLYSERVLERIVGRAQRDPGFAFLIANLFLGSQSTLGALTPANLARYLVWWRTPRKRARR